MKIRIALILIIALMLSTGITEAAPDAAKSKYLKTTAGGISITRGEEPLFYSLTLSVRKKLNAPLYVRSFFERPGKPDEPLIVDSEIQPGEETIFLESPTFQGIENGGIYSITVVLYGGEERKEEVSRHVQEIQFRVPDSAFKKLGLKRP